MKALRPSTPTASEMVIKAADALGISEFDFFRLAYRWWAGEEPALADMERLFVDYMFHRNLPPAVRHLAREVVTRDQAGTLNPADFETDEFRRRSPLPSHPRLHVATMAIITLLYCWGLTSITYDPGTSAPVPCTYAPGFKAFVDFAHGFAGTQPPDCRSPTAR